LLNYFTNYCSITNEEISCLLDVPNKAITLCSKQPLVGVSEFYFSQLSGQAFYLDI